MPSIASQIASLLTVLYDAAPGLVQALIDPAVIEPASLKHRAEALTAISRFIAMLHKQQATLPPSSSASPASGPKSQNPPIKAALRAAAPQPDALRDYRESGSIAAEYARYAKEDRAAAARLGLNYPERFFDPSKDPARHLVARKPQPAPGSTGTR